MAQIFPDWNIIDHFRNKLQDGEREIARYFYSSLSDDWEIYVQPFLNGSRPDIIILNPNFGVMTIEVKDWDLWNYHFKDEKLYLITRTGDYHKLNPIEQAERYQHNLMDIIPGLEKYSSSFSLGVYLHKGSQEEVEEFFKNAPKKGQNVLLMGYDGLDTSKIESIFQKKTSKKKLIPEGLLKEIRNWLNPPEHLIENSSKIKLTEDQLRHAKPKKGHHRIKGVIGSGKTLVLAYRAAALAKQNYKVLIVTYNKTLSYYIQDMINRTPFKFSPNLIVCQHFHKLCTDILTNMGYPIPVTEDYDEDDCNDNYQYFKQILPNSVKDALKVAKKHNENIEQFHYDAILIDEGQDFEFEWYELLCQFLSQRNELVLMCDDAQNIYGVDTSWIYDEMKGFRGRWGELKQSMRLPPNVVREANRFAEMYLSDISMHAEEYQTQLTEPELRWISCSPRNVAFDKAEAKNVAFDQAEAAYDYLFKEKNEQPTDIVMLFTKKTWGKQMVERFKQKRKLEVNHTFDDRHKKAFRMGDARTKMSTIHSFKGWELNNIIIVIDFSSKSENKSSRIYTAIGRTKRNLIVINLSNDYSNYGKMWPQTDKFKIIEPNTAN